MSNFPWEVRPFLILTTSHPHTPSIRIPVGSQIKIKLLRSRRNMRRYSASAAKSPMKRMEAARPLRLTTIGLFRLSRIMMKTLDTALIISLTRLPPLPKTGDLPNISILENKKISHRSHKHWEITSIPPKLKSNHTLKVIEWHWMLWKVSFNLNSRTSARKQMYPLLLETLALRLDRMNGKIKKKA